MGRCRDPLCVGTDGGRTRYPAWECADGDFLCRRTGCTAWVDSTLADFASTVDVDMDYMEGFERFA